MKTVMSDRLLAPVELRTSKPGARHQDRWTESVRGTCRPAKESHSSLRATDRTCFLVVSRERTTIRRISFPLATSMVSEPGNTIPVGPITGGVPLPRKPVAKVSTVPSVFRSVSVHHGIIDVEVPGRSRARYVGANGARPK